MVLPELPAYLDSLGGGEYKGFIIALFTVTAGLSRPFSGKLADTLGRVPVMVIGAMVCGFAALFYPLVSGIAGFFLLRLFHGFSTGFKPTGTSAYVADLIPYDRRGEAMGVLGSFSSLGIGLGPWIGSYIATNFSLDAMFYASSGIAVLSILVLFGMKETLANPQKFSVDLIQIKKDDFFEPRVLAPSINMALSVFSYGAVFTVIPDLSDALQVSYRGEFFFFFTAASMFVRLLIGKASDKYGRVPVLKIGAVIIISSMLILSQATNYYLFVAGAVLFGIGVGIHSPTIYAWTIDLSDQKHRGRGVSTMYIALEIGIGVGALVSGWIFANQLENIPYVFYLSATMVMMSYLYLFTKPVRRLRLNYGG